MICDFIVPAVERLSHSEAGRHAWSQFDIRIQRAILESSTWKFILGALTA